MADKKHKRAREKQSESLSQPCAITVYGEGAVRAHFLVKYILIGWPEN